METVKETIKNNWKLAILVVLVFMPTSKLVFSLLGFASGLVNWGLLILVALVFGAVKGKDMFSGWLNESDKEGGKYDPFS
jgi:hypothetical protein